MRAGDKKTGKGAPKGASKPTVRDQEVEMSEFRVASRKDVNKYENREMKSGKARSGGYRTK